MLAKRFNLGGGLDATISHDLFEDAKTRFEPLHVLSILSALFSSQMAL